MMEESLFLKFCKYVDKTIFSKENVGETVAFIVDQTFIDDFCKEAGVKEDVLLSEVRARHYSVYSRNDILSIKGIIAIQLYAATKRDDSDEMTERNYRDRFVQLLKWTLKDFNTWMEDNQEKCWNRLYDWCDKNDFRIAKCEFKTGSGRFVQFPLQQAARIFTQKDLKYIAYYFVKNNLQPGEDIQEEDFWRILSKKGLSLYIKTNHGRKLMGNEEYAQDAPRQVYNYYLKWDGSYINPITEKTKRLNAEKFFLYLKGDFSSVDVRDERMNLEQRIELNNSLRSSLEQYYRFKRPCCIIFHKNDIYDDYWEETRYLEKEEEGLALIIDEPIFQWHSVTRTHPEFCNSKLIFSYGYGKIKIYQFSFSDSDQLSNYFSTEKLFSLDGGLKIGRMKFMRGGAPILRLFTRTAFYIDGERLDKNLEGGGLNLNYLPIGKHTIKIPNSRKVEFEILEPISGRTKWSLDFNRWIFDMSKGLWSSDKCEDGIVGLDFSLIKMATFGCEHSESDITRWARFHLSGQCAENENNIAIKLLSK